MFDRISKIFDAPSRRRDGDYSKEVTDETVFSVFLLYRDLLDAAYQWDEYWMPEVVGEMAHLHHSLANVDRNRGFYAISEFLLKQQIPKSAFLDFLETSLRHPRAPNDNNDFVDAINRVLEEYDSPYLLSRYARREVTEPDRVYGGTHVHIYFDAFPRAYLKHEAVVQKQAIEPALEIFSDPAYATPAEDFRTALNRRRTGDYDGCVTACSSAVEGTIKVVSQKLGWRKVKGNGLGALAQSFVSKSSLPDALQASFRPLASWRNTQGDAHGHATKDDTTEEIAQHFIAEAASLIVLIQSQTK